MSYTIRWEDDPEWTITEAIVKFPSGDEFSLGLFDGGDLQIVDDRNDAIAVKAEDISVFTEVLAEVIRRGGNK